MHRFQVFEASEKGAEIALMDSQGLCHIALTTGSVPPIGTELDGLRGSPGLARLQCTTTGKLFRISFVELNLDRQTSIERLHPRVTL